MQTQKVPAKKSFKVDELAKELGVKKFILKNWEKQFDLKKCGLDNKYSQEDFKIFAAIKNLVFIKKMPQSIAKKHLQEILAGKEFIESKQEPVAQMTQEVTEQEIVAQDSAAQESKDQIAAEMICEQEQEIAEIATLEKAIHEMAGHGLAAQELPTQDLFANEPIQTITEKDFIEEPETTFQGAHEDLQSENIAEDIVETKISTETSQIDFADKNENMLPEEDIQQDTLSANSVENLTDIKPALQEKEAFIKNIQSFKEQLLKIHDQLK